MKTLASGFLLVLPVYLAVLLMLKGMKSVAGLVRPLAALRPSGMSSEVAENVLAVLVVLVGCFALGVAVDTRVGRTIRERIEQSVFMKIPGYDLFRSLTQQLAGRGDERKWKPALVELGTSVVVAFIIEDIGDGRYAVFVPSVPSPVVGSVHILRQERVHPVNVSFAQTFQALSQWGSGVKKLVAALESEQRSVQPGSKAS